MRITCPALKMGPGESARSHQADEFVLIEELEKGIEGYIAFISQLTAEFTNDAQIERIVES